MFGGFGKSYVVVVSINDRQQSEELFARIAKIDQAKAMSSEEMQACMKKNFDNVRRVSSKREIGTCSMAVLLLVLLRCSERRRASSSGESYRRNRDEDDLVEEHLICVFTIGNKQELVFAMIFTFGAIINLSITSPACRANLVRTDHFVSLIRKFSRAPNGEK